VTPEDWIEEKLRELRISGPVLDVCCGDGALVHRLARSLGVLALGVDRDPRSLRWGTARSAASRGDAPVSFAAMDAEALGFASGSVAAVTCVHSLHHLSNPSRGLAEFRRVLRSDGLLFLVDWEEHAQTGVPERYFGSAELRSLIESADFSVHSFEIRDQQYFVVAAPARVGADEDRDLKRRIEERLRTVIDPETNIDVVTMGLIRDLRVDRGRVSLKFRPSSPFCPIAIILAISIKRAVQEVEGVEEVDVEVIDFIDAETVNRELRAI